MVKYKNMRVVWLELFGEVKKTSVEFINYLAVSFPFWFDTASR